MSPILGETIVSTYGTLYDRKFSVKINSLSNNYVWSWNCWLARVKGEDRRY